MGFGCVTKMLINVMLINVFPSPCYLCMKFHFFLLSKFHLLICVVLIKNDHES